MQPPPDVPRNMNKNQAMEPGRRYLTDPAISGPAPVPIHGVKKVTLMVVRPPAEPLPGFGHSGEPSRIAWAVEYSEARQMPWGLDTSHPLEACIDVEDGSFLGTVRYK